MSTTPIRPDLSVLRHFTPVDNEQTVCLNGTYARQLVEWIDHLERLTPALRSAGVTGGSLIPEEAKEGVRRIDRYTIEVNGVRVSADIAQEQAIRSLDATQREAFVSIMRGGRGADATRR